MNTFIGPTRKLVPNTIECMLHMTRKLNVFRSSALALNQIYDFNIPFNSPELLILSKVNARYCLRIFVNSTTVTCLNKLNLSVTRRGNTINISQNQVKVSNLRQLTAGTSFIAGY